MADNPAPASVHAGWLEALAESDADLAARRIVPGEEVMRDLQGSLDRLKARAAAKKRRGAANAR
jgi:hypothetical protein